MADEIASYGLAHMITFGFVIAFLSSVKGEKLFFVQSFSVNVTAVIVTKRLL